MVSDRERALFEAGIKLGALYHQFTGTPVDLETAKNLEGAIEGCVSLQPYVREVKVSIDREMIRKRINRFGYCELEGIMLNVRIKVLCGKTEVEASLGPEDGYPMMKIEEIRENGANNDR
ncbi:MAG: dihydroneopterin aldolase family protein [Candidatus Syntropharchaeia archaeon]